jgi:hypothetical protein
MGWFWKMFGKRLGSKVISQNVWDILQKLAAKVSVAAMSANNSLPINIVE